MRCPLFEQVPRQFPYNNLFLERGGDPSREGETLVGPVKSTYGEITS